MFYKLKVKLKLVILIYNFFYENNFYIIIYIVISNNLNIHYNLPNLFKYILKLNNKMVPN